MAMFNSFLYVYQRGCWENSIGNPYDHSLITAGRLGGCEILQHLIDGLYIQKKKQWFAVFHSYLIGPNSYHLVQDFATIHNRYGMVWYGGIW